MHGRCSPLFLKTSGGGALPACCLLRRSRWETRTAYVRQQLSTVQTLPPLPAGGPHPRRGPSGQRGRRCAAGGVPGPGGRPLPWQRKAGAAQRAPCRRAAGPSHFACGERGAAQLAPTSAREEEEEEERRNARRGCHFDKPGSAAGRSEEAGCGAAPLRTCCQAAQPRSAP